MADQVRTDIVFKSQVRAVIHMIGLSDGTGETLVKKVDLADLGYDGLEAPYGVAIEKMTYHVSGSCEVRLFWDKDPIDIPFATMDGFGHHNYKDFGGLVDPSVGDDNGSGNILLSSIGAFNNDSYDITLYLRILRHNVP